MAVFAWLLAITAALITSVIAAAAPPSPTPPASLSFLAPADEYFGRLRLSILGIRHEIFTLKAQLHQRKKSAADVAHDADAVDDAFYDWKTRYPKDRWLARTGWELGTLYEELPGTDARDRAVRLLTVVRDQFAGTSFADLSAADLRRGIGVRAAPVAGSRITGPPVTDAPGLLAAIRELAANAAANKASGGDALRDATRLEDRFRYLSQDGSKSEYGECAWQLAALYESLSGEDARTRAIRMLALVVDRYGSTAYAAYSLHDLERGVGLRK